MFSIIIPCYNVEKYISGTINSVLKQSFNNFELILINDGSTDKTLEILEKYNKIDKRIKVINKNNSGVSSARNVGLEKAKGDYIYFLDGDDIIKSNLLKVANYKFEKYKEIDMFSFAFNIKNEDGEILNNYSFNEFNNKIITSRTFLNLYFRKKIRQSMCSFIIKSDIIKKYNLFFSEDISYGEDQEFQLKTIKNCDNVFYDSTPYFNYLKRKGSAVNRKINLNRIDLLKSLIRVKEYFTNNSIDNQTLQMLDNYISMTFIFLVKEYIKKKGDSNFLTELDNYKYVLKNTTLAFSKYEIISYLLSYLYLINPSLIIKLFKLVYKN